MYHQTRWDISNERRKIRRTILKVFNLSDLELGRVAAAHLEEFVVEEARNEVGANKRFCAKREKLKFAPFLTRNGSPLRPAVPQYASHSGTQTRSFIDWILRFALF